jgi:hypothetical protein
LAFLTQNKAKLFNNFIITLVFEKNANFFRRKLSKIAENCDHSIDPRIKGMHQLKICWATFWAIFSRTHQVTLGVPASGCMGKKEKRSHAQN